MELGLEWFQECRLSVSGLGTGSCFHQAWHSVTHVQSHQSEDDTVRIFSLICLIPGSKSLSTASDD